MASPVLDKRQRLLVAQALLEKAKTESGRAGYCTTCSRRARTPDNSAAWLNERQKHLDTAAELRSLADQLEESVEAEAWDDQHSAVNDYPADIDETRDMLL